jgi:hypothetical protein
MKRLFFVMTILAVGAAMGPSTTPSAFAAERATAASNQPSAPHYEWRYGYEHGGKWRARWVLVK